ncbi:SCP2 domain-containing protein [Pantoea sp. 1.19]|uniref:ubiquinone biosynthesis protein UbiJ n=1 Tax=Pantoea sp. 1.19 TaxID=1925589 RepID=UPI000948D45F|nr:SCP2 domain-containing protein [Pantoea sp. 1.19]
MTLPPLAVAAMETALNAVLYRDRSLKAARQRLNGKVLAVTLRELEQPLVLVFSERQLDVLTHWADMPDCTVTTRLSVLPQLRDRQQLTALIRSGDLDVSGDLQVVQQFSALIDQAECDPAEYLAPWTGDVLAESLSQGARRAVGWVRRQLQHKQHDLSEALTEEWRLAPGSLELAWFHDEVDAAASTLRQLEARLDKMESS